MSATLLTAHLEGTLQRASLPLSAAQLANSAINNGLIPESERGREASRRVASALKPLKAEGVVLQRIAPDARSPEYWWHTHNPDAATVSETETVDDYSQEEAACREILAAENARIEAEEAIEDDTDISDLTELACMVLRQAYGVNPAPADQESEDATLDEIERIQARMDRERAEITAQLDAEFLAAIQNPLRLPETKKLTRWSAVCASLANHDLVSDPIANELLNLERFLNDLLNRAAA